MSQCDVMRETMPLLLTESLDPAERELTHRHIETCANCAGEWSATKETWQVLETLPEVDVPARMKQRFLAEIIPTTAVRTNVVPFPRRRAARWLAEAAAVVIVGGSAFYAGHRAAPSVQLQPTQAQVTAIQQAMPAAPYY